MTPFALTLPPHVQGLKAALALAGLQARHGCYGAAIEAARLRDAVDVILSYQNANGGWPTYELMRSFEAVEAINPAETFGGIMVDYSYVECSSASMSALCAFRKADPEYRRAEISRALDRGIAFVKRIQRPDGSWYGSWAVCFTYGMFFGCKVLRAVGLTVANCPHQRAAVAFLKRVQRPDGGWGESYLSCQDKRYTHLDGALPQPPRWQGGHSRRSRRALCPSCVCMPGPLQVSRTWSIRHGR